MRRRVLFIHTSPAAIAPVKNYFSARAPSLELTNMLDDGVLRFFASEDYAAVEAQLGELIGMGRRVYGADTAVVTCSAVPRDSMQRIRNAAGIPVIKIDEPMADVAVRAGSRVGLLYTFAPTLRPTTSLLESAAAEAGTTPSIVPRFVAGAYDALLAGDESQHDHLVVEAAASFRGEADVLVLAQVSMSHLSERIEAATSVRALSSLSTSFSALQEVLAS